MSGNFAGPGKGENMTEKIKAMLACLRTEGYVEEVDAIEAHIRDLDASIDRAAKRIGDLKRDCDEARNFILSLIRGHGFEFGDDHDYAVKMAEEWKADATSPG